MTEIWWKCKSCGAVMLEDETGWRQTAKHAKAVHGELTEPTFTALSREEVAAEVDDA
jgi:hypothetical protein